MTSLRSERVAQAIREHQIEASDQWKHRDRVKELHVWVDRFDSDFDLGLPTPIIAIGELPWNVLGRYRLGRNELGARTNITLNEAWIPCQPFSETIITLIHELLHAYEEWRLGREKGGWYHTKAWRDKMEEVGIVADDHGITQRVLPRFTDYLSRYGVKAIPRHAQEGSSGQVPSKRRQLPKWVCSCASGKPVRGVYLNARCEDCGQLYRKVNSPKS